MQEKITNVIAIKQVLAKILETIRALSGCQSVGIRLKDNGDYPYYVHEGFPKFFILKENSLCAKDEKGNHILDEKGNPLLECMCGKVINGQFDPKLPYFNKKGSFWTNSTTQLLDITTANQLQSRTRNMCHYNGYESVALIPMKAGNRTLGLIQMNDPRKNMFTPDLIVKYESIADYVAEIVLNAFEIQKRIDDINNLAKEFGSSKK